MNFVLQYDLSTTFTEENGYPSSTVYEYIARLLQDRGYTRHQYSCWRRENISIAEAANDADYIAQRMEIRFGPAPGICIALHYEQRIGFYVVR